MGVYQSKYTGAEIDSGLNPVGTIISFMGTIAPEGFLTCDGAVLNITDYPKLASHFETQFGTKNHFGGDGETTFALPDLRNEFLRGFGELSNEIGKHQDATKHVNLYQNGTTKQFGLYMTQHQDGFNALAYDYDDVEAATKFIQTANSGETGTPGSTRNAYYTSRPTNVAVLYCIKY